jgi:hypothetical protein
MNISPKDRERLNHIWMALEAIEVYTTGFPFGVVFDYVMVCANLRFADIQPTRESKIRHRTDVV